MFLFFLVVINHQANNYHPNTQQQQQQQQQQQITPRIFKLTIVQIKLTTIIKKHTYAMIE